MNNPEFLADLRAFAAATQAKYNWPSLNYTANMIAFAAENIVPRQPKYTQEQLRAAFELVQPELHWKMPIHKRIVLDAEQVELVGEAVIHFTGGSAQFTSTGRPNEYIVIAAGYYACVGA